MSIHQHTTGCLPAFSKWSLAGSIGRNALVSTLLFMSIPTPAYALIDTEKLSVSGSLLAIQQSVNRAAAAADEDRQQFNTRLDLELSYPIDHDRAKIHAHLRSGLGAGVQRANGTFTSTPNTTVFSGNNQEIHDSHTTLFQLWAQTERPLSESVRWRATVGQIDPPSFFDDNAFAHDESEAFMNNAFVHNPLLDSGGSYGVDELGSSPGGVFELIQSLSGETTLRTSVGVFGSGNGGNHHVGMSRPSWIAQAHLDELPVWGRRSSVAVYTWRNPRLENAVSNELEVQTGWGVSADHDLNQSVGVFARYGHGLKGTRNFNKASTGGAQIKGDLWGHPEDVLGLALGTIQADFSALSDPRSERITEIYYTKALSESLALGFNIQRISRPGGDASLPSHQHFALRLKWAF